MGFEHIERPLSCRRFYPSVPFPWETMSIWQTPSLDSETTGGTVSQFLHPVVGESQGAAASLPLSCMHRNAVYTLDFDMRPAYTFELVHNPPNVINGFTK